MKDLSNFQRVLLINQIAAKDAGSKEPTWQAAIQQQKVIESEWQEVKEAIEKRDITALRDGIADLLVTAYGMGAVLGFDCNDDMAAVTTALLTRFDTTEEDAVKTRAKYKELGVVTYTELSIVDGAMWYVTKSTRDQHGINNEFYPAGKFLKSHRFKTEVLEPLPVLEEKLKAS